MTFRVHADRTAFTGSDLRRIVEPGEIDVMVGASSEDIRGHGAFRLTGEPRVVGHDRVLTTPVRRAGAGQPRMTAGPVLSRTTSSSVIAARTRVPSSPRIASSSISTLRSPISSKSWRTVVSGGVR